MEMAAKNPGMDIHSDEFLDMVGERFNDVIRKTQVYDSILVKSSNMRSTAWTARVITAFKAEPTLTANMLMDAWNNRKTAGGKKALGAALGVYFLSAIMQSVIKGIVGAGRTPDEKKTLAENFVNKFAYNFIGEANPISLIPGYSEVVDALSGNDVKDNAYGVISNIYDSLTSARDVFQGKSQGTWKDIENTAGQLTQIVSGIPAKNLMRDARAIYNWAMGSYADRPKVTTDENGNTVITPGRANSGAVIKYQTRDTLLSNDLIGAINKLLGTAGEKTTTTSYYDKIYNAEKAGNTGKADEMREYLQLGKGVTEEKIRSGIASAAKKDDSTTAEEKAEFLFGGGYTDRSNYLTEQYKKGELTDEEFTRLYEEYFPDQKAANKLYDIADERYKKGEIDRKEIEKYYKAKYPQATEDDIWWYFDKVDYANETGKQTSGDYYRVHDAIEGNRSADITAAVQLVMKHGKKKNGVWSSIEGKWKDDYLKMRDGSAEKVRLKDGMIKALKAAGYTAAQAEQMINKWKK